MKKPLLSFLTILFYLYSQSQSISLKWADGFGGTSADEGTSILTDAGGNTYAVGIFNNIMDMDPSAGVYNLTSAGSSDVFIIKLDALGNFIWAKQIGNTRSDNCRSIAIDLNGDIYITGSFYGTVDFDPGPAVSNLTCTGIDYTTYLLKLNSAGDFIWADKIGDAALGASSSYSVKVATNGNIYLTGTFQSTADFDPGAGIFNMTSASSVQDIYISKFDNNGNFIWAKQFPGLRGEVCHSIVLDAQENIYAAGVFYGTCDFDPSPATFNLTANNYPTSNNADAFLAKLDLNGNLLFAKQIEGDRDENASAITLDQSGNIFITGQFFGVSDFDPGPAQVNLDGGGYGSAFVLKLDNSGNLIWVDEFANTGGTSTSQGLSIVTDDEGNVYSIGAFSGGIDFDPGANTYLKTGGNIFNAYISKLDNNGNFIFTEQFEGGKFVVGISLSVDASKNIYITGHYQGSPDFDPGANTFNMTSVGSGDVFIAKLGPPCALNTSSIITDTTCSPYILNGQTYTTSGTYIQTIPNAAGCDSTITLHLTIGGSTTNLSATECDSYFWEGNTYTNSGNYTITYHGIGGCDSIINLNLTIKYSIATIIDTTICEGENYTGYTIANTYIDKYIATNGCDSIRTLILKVNPKKYTTINRSICEGENYEGYTTSNTYYDTYTSSKGCDSIRTLTLNVYPKKFTPINATICEGQTYFAAGINQTRSGVYKDTLSTMFGCDSIITTNLTVNPKPYPNLGQDRGICAESSLTLNPGSYDSYLWQDMTTLPTFTAKAVGLYWVNVKNNYNCVSTDSIIINRIYSAPANFLKSTENICSFEKLLITPLENYSTYLWSNNSIQSNLLVSTPGNYWLKVSDVNGCFGTDTITVLAKQCLTGFYIPTAFTPNNDGQNDIFKPIIGGNIQTLKFVIYNRWGEIVFESNNLNKGWDGTFKGIQQSPGTFVWTCIYQLEGENQEYKKGNLVLIR